MQRALAEPAHADRLTVVDRRVLLPLYWSHLNPYRTFRLDMEKTHLDLDQGPVVGGLDGYEPTP